MGPLAPLAKSLVVLGLAVAGLGALLLLASKLPWLGRLPGDLHIKRNGGSVYIPLTTSLLMSALASLLLYFLKRRP